MKILKILKTPSKTITSAAVVLSLTTLLSRLMGIFRDRALAHHFGAGPIVDVYYASFKIPDLIYNLLIAGALTAGFIPVFTKLFYQHENKSTAWKLANNVTNIVGIILIILCGLGIIFAPFISPILVPGFSAEQKELVLEFTRIMFLSPLLLGFSMVLGGILQSLRQFAIYSIAPIFYNAGIIIGILYLVPLIGKTGLAWGVILGALLHLVIQIYGAYHQGYRWHLILNFKDPNTRLIGKLMIPRTLGLAATQLNTVIVTVLASILPIGSVAIYNYASNLQGVPVGMIGIPFAVAVFPVLSKCIAEKNLVEFKKNFSTTLRQILFLVIPLSVLFLLLRAQIVRVLLGTGEFDWNATISTADALAVFAMSIWAASLIQLFARAFYALQNSKIPFMVGIISEIITLALALLFINIKHTIFITLPFQLTISLPLFGVNGLALASTLGTIINAILLFVFLRKKIGNLKEEHFFSFTYRLIIAGIIMGITIQILKYPVSRIVDMDRWWGILIHGLFTGIIGLFIYGLCCFLLKIKEINSLYEGLKIRWSALRSILPSQVDKEL
jgi:putative peptidoglycan lipid II flippase